MDLPIEEDSEHCSFNRADAPNGTTNDGVDSAIELNSNYRYNDILIDRPYHQFRMCHFRHFMRRSPENLTTHLVFRIVTVTDALSSLDTWPEHNINIEEQAILYANMCRLNCSISIITILNQINFIYASSQESKHVFNNNWMAKGKTIIRAENTSVFPFRLFLISILQYA